MSTSKIILGTVQFGLDYGINNRGGKIPERQVFKILDLARESGILALDTADAYGAAVDIIGRYHKNTGGSFDIINKIKTQYSKSLFFDYLKKSLDTLRIDNYSLLMFHSFSEYINSRDILEQMIVAKRKGLIKKIGVSLYTNQELVLAIEDKDIDTIQLPFNLLDNESQKGDLLKEAKVKGKTIHVRSVFLQGLFFKDCSTFHINLKPIIEPLKQLQKLTNTYNTNMSQLALQYVLSKEYIDGVVIGVDSVTQLAENIVASQQTLISELLVQIDEISIKNNEILNPSKWNLK